jgi:citrate lyase subunit beta-like protein
MDFRPSISSSSSTRVSTSSLLVGNENNYRFFPDNEGLQRQSLQGAHWGFTGKQIIHPNQIEIVQTAFLPAADRARWAQEIMASFEEHQKTGKGAFTHRDAMIDMPTVKQAQNILEIMKKQAPK